MKIVCCCVTEDRPEFMPWLLWNFEKQTHADKHLLVVDTSTAPLSLHRPWVTVIHRAHGMSLPTKANLAIEASDGDAIAWMDDDDWQDPRRLEILSERMVSGIDIVGTNRGAWVNLEKRVMVEHRSPMMIFNSCLVRSDAARSVTFDESILKTSDTKWMRELLAKYRTVTIPERLHAWVCHGSNICNPASSRDWSGAKDVQDVLGVEATYALRSITERMTL